MTIFSYLNLVKGKLIACPLSAFKYECVTCSKQTSKALVCPFLFVWDLLIIIAMNFEKNYCQYCKSSFPWEANREALTWLKSFTCDKCGKRNIMILSKRAQNTNVAIMIIFWLLSASTIVDSNWGGLSIAEFLGRLTWNCIFYIPFIFSLISFLRHKKLEQQYLIVSSWFTGTQEQDKDDIIDSNEESNPIYKSNKTV